MSSPFHEKKVLDTLKRVRARVEALAGREITPGLLSEFGGIAAEACLNKRGKETWNELGQMKKDALHDSVVHLLGKKVSSQILVANMHRVIANWHLIEQGVAIPLWHGEQITSDVLFMAITRETRGDRFIYHVKTKLRTGLAAGIILSLSLYDGQICRFLDKEAGVGKWNCAAEEISGMRARLTHSRFGDSDRIDEWHATESQKEHNRKLTEARADMAKCKKLIPCNTCKCTVSQCPLAVWDDIEQPKKRK